MCYIAILYYRCADKRIEGNKRKQHEISSRIRYGIFLRFVKGRKKWYNTGVCSPKDIRMLNLYMPNHRTSK